MHSTASLGMVKIVSQHKKHTTEYEKGDDFLGTQQQFDERKLFGSRKKELT